MDAFRLAVTIVVIVAVVVLILLFERRRARQIQRDVSEMADERRERGRRPPED